MSTSDKSTKELRLSQLMDGEWHELDRAECVASLCADEALRKKWARFHIIRDAMKNEPVQADQALVSRICSAIDKEPAYTNITPFTATASVTRPAATMSEDSAVMVDETSEAADNVEAELPAVSVSRVQPVVAQIEAARKPSWMGTGVTGFALAASVALVTVLGVNVFDQETAAPDVSVVADNAARSVQGDSAVLPVVDFVANTGSYWVSPDSATRVSDEERLNMMLSQHLDNSPTASREGLLPYSRLVGYRTIEQER